MEATVTLTHLFAPLNLGALTLPNRIIMAPLTRCRADQDHLPTPLMAEYYAQRATAGLIISECAMVMPNCSAFGQDPGIYSSAQVDAWKQVTDAVHAKGGRIFMQIWHGGRACHPALNGGQTPVAPSALAIEDEVYTPEGKQPYTIPHALSVDEIATIVAGFKQGAINAKAAGFDGVEVHGANGYLLDQFLRSSSNQRTDSYGGSIENRARLLFEVLEAVIDVWGADRVGLRISPVNSFNSMKDEDPIALTRWLSGHLNRFNLAYLHLMRADFFGLQQGDVIGECTAIYQGQVIANMGYSAEEADEAIASGTLAAVAFGVPYLANPDLPERFKAGAPLNSADPETFYTDGAKGYTDYPVLPA